MNSPSELKLALAVQDILESIRFDAHRQIKSIEASYKKESVNDDCGGFKEIFTPYIKIEMRKESDE